MSWSPPDVRRSPGSTVLPEAEPPAHRGRLQDLAAAVSTVAVVVLLGAPLGLLWSALAPHSHVAVEAGLPPFIADAESEVFIAGDGWFLGLTLLAGVVTGILAWLLVRRSAPFVVVGLAAGGLLAAYVASKVGVRIGQESLRAAVRSGHPGTYTSNIALQMKTAIAAWPLGAVVAFSTLVASRVDGID